MYKYFIIKENMHVVKCEHQPFAQDGTVIVRDKRDLTIDKARPADSVWKILRPENVAVPMKHVYLQERNDETGRLLLREYYQSKLSTTASKEDKLKDIISNLS